MSEYTGLFKSRYPNITGSDWIRKVDPDDRRVFVQIGHEHAEHGRLGGFARASSAKRDSRGRFVSADGSNSRTGTDPRKGTANDPDIW